MKKALINNTHIEGLLYEHKLEEKVTGPQSKNPGTKYIAGTVDIATDDALTNIVSVHFSYVTPTTAKGTANATYAILADIISGRHASIMGDGAEKAAKLRIDSAIALNEFYSAIVSEELNVKNLEFTQEVGAFTSYTFKPQLKTLGPKYGKDLGKIRTMLTELDGNAAMAELDEKGTLSLDLGDKVATLTKEDLLIDMAQKEGFEAVSDRGITVVIDTTLTDELIEEGFVREIISRIQTMRKEADFEVMDHISVYQKGSEELKAYIA